MVKGVQVKVPKVLSALVFHLEQCFLVAFSTHVSRALPGLFAVRIIWNAPGLVLVLRTAASACPAREARAGLSLLTKSGQDGTMSLETVSSGCWRQHAGLFTRRTPSPHPSASAGVLASYLLQQCLAHGAFKLGITQHTMCLGHFAKLRVCFYVKRNTIPHFKVANLINFLKVESYIGKKPAETKGWCQNKGKFTKMF